MSKKDELKSAVSDFHNIYATPEPTLESQFKKTMTFYFSYTNHAYLKALAEVYGVPVTTIGHEFFESMVPAIIANLPEDYRNEVCSKSLDFQKLFLTEQGYTDFIDEMLVDWSVPNE